MTSSIRTPADLVNDALRRIAYKGRIGSLYEGSVAAKVALDLYAQTRDAVLQATDYDFAQKIAAGVVSVTAAPFPWSNAYAYPNDCLRLRMLFDGEYTTDPNNPLPLNWTIGNVTSGKQVWCNVANATFVYTLQLTDLTLWQNPLAIEAFAVELGKRMAPGLTGEAGWKLMAEEEKTILPLAEGTMG